MWNHSGMMDGFGWFGGGGGMLFGPLIMIGVLALIIYLIMLFVRQIGGSRNDPATSQHSPLDILKERYARGEIDEREYEERKKILLK